MQKHCIVSALQVFIVEYFKYSSVSLSLQLFPQIDGVMVKPLREAYEHYENKRIEEEKLRRARNERTRSTEEQSFASRSTSQGGVTESPAILLSQPVILPSQPIDTQEDRDEDNEKEKQV